MHLRRLRRLRGTSAILIIMVMLLGIVAGAYSYYNSRPQSPISPDCPIPPITFTNYYTAFVNQVEYRAVNVTFTSSGQPLVLPGFDIQFLTVNFTDPSITHLQDGKCVKDSSSASLALQVRFNSDHTVEHLGPVPFKGQNQYLEFSNHTNPTAGVLYQPGDTHIILLARNG